jgi:hypothetical protein
MKAPAAFAALVVAALVVTAARSGHELPIYPSYYPQDITITSIAPQQAGEALTKGRIQAYVGGEPRFAGTQPDFVRAIESLGSFVTVRINPQSTATGEEACALARAVVGETTGKAGEFVFHPYPVTPLHGDYLYYVDLAEAAKARFSAPPSAPAALKVKAAAGLASTLIRPDWLTQGPDWDAAIEVVDAADLAATFALNGWIAPPWARSGWFHAQLLLADDAAPEAKEHAEEDRRRLTAGRFDDLPERINLERDLVTALTTGCRKVVAGYTVRRETVSAEYSAGIENIGFDAIDGLASPMFVRTAKLKDFPWNGSLALGIDGKPAAAWNPIAGMTDKFGRLLWWAVGDPALIPAPYDAGFMLNRASDVQSNVGR